MANPKDKDQTNKIQSSLLFEVKSIIGLSSVGGESKFSIRLDFNGTMVGESAKLDLLEGDTIYPNHVFKYICQTKDINDLDFLINNPFVLILNEFKPKEKKQKESKVEQVGEIAFDCLELVQGETKIEKVFPLLRKFYGNQEIDDTNPKVTVVMSTDSWSIGKKELEENSILFIHIDSLQSLPEKLCTKENTSTFVAALPLYSLTEPDVSVQFFNGLTRAPTDSEYYEKSRHWNQQNVAQGLKWYIPGSFKDSRIKLSEEDGDFRGVEYLAFRQACDSERPKVVWNQERRCILTKDMVQTLRNRIAWQKLWPVEVARSQKSVAPKGKKDGDVSLNYHGVAYVNLAPLIYPGATKLRGAYRIVPFMEAEYTEKAKRSTCLLTESPNVIPIVPVGASTAQKRTANNSTAKQERKPGKPILEEHDTVDDEMEPMGQPGSVDTDHPSSQMNSEGQQYLESQSFILLEFRLNHPLVPKRTAEEVDQKILNYLSQSGRVPSRTLSAQKAVDHYHKQIAEVAHYILADFRNKFGELIQMDQLPVDAESTEQLKHELFYSLNSTGKYFAFKERLKFAVMKLVREKFFRTTPFTKDEHLQQFLRDLYVYLIDEMHIGLKQVFQPRERTIQPEGDQLDLEQLKRFAHEAATIGEKDVAKLYYGETIARNPGCPSHWITFGRFYLQNRDFEQAEVCIHKVLELDPKHPLGLMLYGLVAGIQNRVEEATDFLEAAVFVDKLNVVAWTVLGLHYETTANDIGSEMALNEAVRLDLSANSVEPAKSGEFDSETAPVDVIIDSSTQNLSLAKEENQPLQKELGEINNVHLDAAGLIEVNKTEKPGSYSSRSSSQRTRKHNYPSRMSRGVKQSLKAPTVLAPRESPQPISPIEPPRYSHFLRAAEFLLDHYFYQLASVALAHELINSKKQIDLFRPNEQAKQPGEMIQSNTAETETAESITACLLSLQNRPDWLVQQFIKFHLARIRLTLGSEKADFMSEAELEANWITELDPQSVEAWAQLGHLHYLSGDLIGSRSFYERCLDLRTWPPKDPHVLRLRLGLIYLQMEEFQKAKNMFLAASRESPTCMTWMGVGIACYRMNELDNAEQALIEANYLNNRNPKVWAYLSLICLKTNRPQEAEQTYKYAIKLRLHEQSLLDELHALQADRGFGNPLASWRPRSCTSP